MPTLSLLRNCMIPRLVTELALVSFALILVGCASSRVDEPGSAASDAPRSLDGLASSDVEQRILSEYARWRGTPHVLGGTTTRGLDCSAFVQRVYSDAFDLHLPRTTEDQVREGRRISSSDLEPGDLVFFRPSKTRHVGIYLSDGDFAHVSSTEGVTISRMDLPYWRDAYWTSRRILPNLAAVRTDSRQERQIREVVSSPHEGRVGW